MIMSLEALAPSTFNALLVSIFKLAYFLHIGLIISIVS